MSRWELGKGQFGGFKKRMDNLVPRRMKVVMLEAYRLVIKATPVDTGRARWGWQCSVNGIDYGSPAPAPVEYSREHKVFYRVDGMRAREAFAHVNAEDTLYIANSLPYIKRLNEGWSTQAGARFVEIAVAQAVEKDSMKYGG